MTSDRRVKVVVYILVVIFAVAAWIDINSLWQQLPIMVQELPEAWNLPSYLVLIIQLGNIGPLLYKFICAGRIPEKLTVFLIIITGGIATLLMIFFWKETTVLAGSPHSIGLFVLTFITAYADCTATVVYYPFMASLKPGYMSAYFTGMGLGNLLPALLGIAQGSGQVVCFNVTKNESQVVNRTLLPVQVTVSKTRYENRRFSLETFYSVITGIIVLSCIALALVMYHPYCKREHEKPGNDGYRKEEVKSKVRDTPASVNGDNQEEEEESVSKSESVTVNANVSHQQLSGPSIGDTNKVTGTLPSELTNLGTENGTSGVATEARTVYQRRTDDPDTGHQCYDLSATVSACNGGRSLKLNVGSSRQEKAKCDKMINGINTLDRLPKDITSEQSILTGNHSTPLKKQSNLLDGSGYIWLLLLNGWICSLMHSILVGIDSYSLLPYGTTEYFLGITLRAIASPTATLCSHFLYVTSGPAVYGLSLVTTLISAYIITSAAMSPSPVLVGTLWGSILIVASWVICMFLLSYLKCVLAQIFRQGGQDALFKCAASTQIGSFFSGILMFVLVNVLQLFRSVQRCSH